MYLFFGILLFLLILFFAINHFRKKKIIKKMRSMCMDEKCQILHELIEPFGYCYVSSQDIFTSHIDAFQRAFGYCAFYDKAAPHFHMIFDCLPVYFDYQNRTWLIEFWKGQYGINTGCEIGVYYADRLLEEDELASTLFQCAGNEDMPMLSVVLFRNTTSIAHLKAKHWWLTAFDMGCFSEPSDLFLRASVTLKSPEMAKAFAMGLQKAGCCQSEICICCNTVSFAFMKTAPSGNMLRKLRIRIIQKINHFWCRVYLFVTRPFCLSIDKILYLYYYLPFAFRRMLRIRRYRGKSVSGKS